MTRKGNQQKNGVDYHASNHKKRNSDAGCTVPDKKGHGKTDEFKVLRGEQLSDNNQPSSPAVGNVSTTNHVGAEGKSKKKSRKSFREKKQEMDAMQGSEYSTSLQSNSQDYNGNIEYPSVSEENMSQRKENDSEFCNDLGQMHRKSGLGFSFMQFQNVLGSIELPDNNVVIMNLKASTLSILMAVKEWLEKQTPSYDRLRVQMQNSVDYVQTKIKWAYPIVLKWLMQCGSILLILSLLWLDCTLRGIDSLIRMGTTSFFSVIWCSIISVIAMVGLLKFLVVLATAAIVGVFIGLTLAVLLVAFSGAVFLWLYGSFWTTLLVIFLGGLTFAISQDRIALLITSVYSLYCAWTYVGWLGLFLVLNLSFISTDALIYFLKNNNDPQHRRSNGSPQEAPGMRGQQRFVNSEQANASNPEIGGGFSMDRGPGIPSTSGVDSEITSEEEVVRLLNCTDHYSALGFSRFEDIDVSLLKREYRKKAMLVHPDKNMGNEKAAEAFKKLHNAYEVLLDSIKRKAYDDELRREELLNIFRRFQGGTSQNSARPNSFPPGSAHSEADFEDLFGDSRRIACKKCGNFHLWILTKKSKSRARWCQDCNDLHQAKDGDGWVEQSSQPVFFGLLQKVDAPCAYVCADSKIYNATEWYICQGMRCPTNTHKPSFHVNTSMTSKHNTGKGSSTGKRGSQMPASSNMEENMTEEEFYEWLQNAMQSGMFENTSGSTAETPYAKPGNSSKNGGNNSGSGNKKKKKGKKQW